MVKIIKQSYEILTNLNGLVILKNIEKAARTCYKSERFISEDGQSAKALVKMLTEKGHTAMLEHGGTISVKLICNRGLTHELVRHRLASYAQESTRYCDYSKDKHGSELTVILPLDYEKVGKMLQYELWKEAMKDAEKWYFKLRTYGVPPQIARGVLPIDIKTEIIISANPTEWRHIFRLRTSEAAHPQIRYLMRDILHDFCEKIPIIFDDITY
ncbi:hypothetical protein LCGC14_1850850 [marine sediment metagenome]|uniref:Thymidylate synthase (FAD) n=1 Tax=marine sediment metagenome TaxID=412755 RepID=A0A0F9GYR4_9ZZZZ